MSACTPQIVKDSAPSIRSTIGKEKAPAPDVLPIIESEDVAADPQKAADNYRELLKLKPDVDTRDESTRRLADLQVQMADSSGASPDSEKAVRESIKSEEHTPELQSLIRISSAVFCLKKKKN